MDVGVLRYRAASTKVLELDVWTPTEVVCAMACYIVSCRVCLVFSLRCVTIFQKIVAKLDRNANKDGQQGRRGAQVIADGGARKTLESVAISPYGH